MMKQLLFLYFISLTTLTFGQKTYIRRDSFDNWQLSLSKKQNKNVLDYYLLLPGVLFDCERGLKFDEEGRKSKIKLLDIRNGYIEFTGTYNNLTIALFKDTLNRKDFIAISSNVSGRGTSCGGFNMIMEFLQDTVAWKYRNDLLPSKNEEKPYLEKYYSDLNDMNPYFELPRYGLIVALREEGSEKPVYRMKWTGTRFEIIN